MTVRYQLCVCLTTCIHLNNGCSRNGIYSTLYRNKFLCVKAWGVYIPLISHRVQNINVLLLNRDISLDDDWHEEISRDLEEKYFDE